MKQRAIGRIGILLLSAGIIAFTTNAQSGKTYKAYSPDKTTVMEVGLNENKALLYRIQLKGKSIIDWSPLGLAGSNVFIGTNVVISGIQRHKVDTAYESAFGENDRVSIKYREMKLECMSGLQKYTIVFRIFNGSACFRYEMVSENPERYQIKSELTGFNLTTGYTVYQYNQESIFNPVSSDSLLKPSDLPTTLTNGNYYISIGEANNLNYTKVGLKRGKTKHSLGFIFPIDKVISFKGAFSTPWRTISIAETAKDLHQFSELNSKLAAPPTGDPIVRIPGKLIRAQLNTQSGIDCIDFAASHNFQYIMFDAGWYGNEYDSASDPSKVIPAIDMHKVIAYGNEKKIGVILYVNYIALKSRLDDILPLFKEWNIKGIKFGFVDGVTQHGLTWLTNAIKKVNDAGFVLNIHDNYKPTGLSRTYPGLFTQEGIRGDENSPDAFHNTVLPFTRFLAGAADFTFCYPNSKNSFSKNIKVSMAQQMALTVIYFSPLQSMFWYGQPKDYINEKEIDFFKYVPTVWNESHYLTGEIGKNIAVARRNKNVWFVGLAAGMTDWNGNLPLNFLTRNKQYIATIYEDDNHAKSVNKREWAVTFGQQFPIDIKAKGGQAIIIREK